MRSISIRSSWFGRCGRPAAGFTLIELLVVIAVVGVLAALTLSISSGARERAARERARAELAVLATALERYRTDYGAYPQISGDPASLWQALSGRLSPSGAPDNRRPFATLSGLTLDEAGEYLIDPWGAAYHYQFFRSGVRSGFRLYSPGPDGRHLPPDTSGIINENADENLDNISLTP